MRVFSVWALLVLGISGTAGAASLIATRAEALRLYALGRDQDALPLFDQVLAQKPRDLDVLNKRACIYLRMNQPERALADLDKATRISPFLAYDAMAMNRQYSPDVQTRPPASLFTNYFLYAPPFGNRGIALLMLGRDDEALTAFRMANSIRLSQWPQTAADRKDMASAYCGIGQVYLRKGDAAEALNAFDRALSYNPSDPNAHIGRGEGLLALGQYEAALNSYGEAVRLAPDHSRAFGYRAAALERIGNDELALADYDAAIRLDPTAATARRMRAALLSRLGRNGTAVADLDAVVRLDPTNASALKDRGGVYNRMGDHARALRDLDEAIRLDPRSSKAYQNRAAAYNGLGQYERALRDCDEALRLNPRNAGALNNRGLALSALGRNESARADLTESIRLEPHQVPAYHNRGGANARLGLFADAVADYEEVLRRAPGLEPAELGLRYARESLRRRTGPDRDDLALREPPTADRRAFDQANARRASGDWSGAIAGYSRALDADPRNAEALAFRGWSRACAGEPAPAARDARDWLDSNGWRAPFAPYMAMLGVIAARQAGNAAAATTFLDEALANSHPADWPAPVFRYLKRTLSSMDLLSAAADAPDRLTEARVVIGLDLLHRGERSAALDHLRWVRDHGLEGSIARDLARETLRRVEQ